MAKRDDDLFQRLRRAGVRKPIAQGLSELTEDAGKKAADAGHKAVSELRALVEEIEKRLPVPKFVTQSLSEPAAAVAKPRRVTKPRAKPTAAESAAKPARAKRAGAQSTGAKQTPTRRPRTTAAETATATTRTATPKSSPAPRGANKTKILAALSTGPQTASEISESTGIATTTVSSALNRLSKTGEVFKASRGYALPS